MGYLMPAWELDVEDIKAIKQQVIDLALQRAMKMTGLAADQLVVRNILPSTDLGLTNEVWSFSLTTANDWNNIVTKQLDDQQFLVIFGVAVLSADPITTALRFKVGSGTGTKTLDVVDLEELYASDERPEGILKRPILYKEKQYVNIDVYAKATGTENLVFKGFVIEPAGRVTF